MINTVSPFNDFNYQGFSMKVYHANKGEGLPKHDHQFSHATMCNAGSIAVRKEGKQVVLDKFSMPVNLPPNEWHEIEALEDNTVFINIFAEGKY